MDGATSIRKYRIFMKQGESGVTNLENYSEREVRNHVGRFKNLL